MVEAERVRALVPRPLPPEPPLQFDAPLQVLQEQALLALGRLDTLSTLLPDTALFLYGTSARRPCSPRRSRGRSPPSPTCSSSSSSEAPGVPLDDVAEVSNYVAALDHGLERLRGGFPLSNRLIREIHGVLLSRRARRREDPGEFRRSQNWIGGTRPGNAPSFRRRRTPSPDCMAASSASCTTGPTPLPCSCRPRSAHVQFETIHPFLDGNGRIGRLLITLLLCHSGILRKPLLYLSLYFKQHRDDYYDCLDRVRSDGDWEAWLASSSKASSRPLTARRRPRRLLALFEEDRDASGPAVWRTPPCESTGLSRPGRHLAVGARARTGLSFPATSRAWTSCRSSPSHELTGRKRNRVFAYDRYLAS